MIKSLLSLAGISYALIMSGAVGGLAFANIFGMGALFFVEDRNTQLIGRITHGGWFFGVGVAVIGTVMQTVKRRHSRKRLDSSNATESSSKADDKTTSLASESKSIDSNPNDQQLDQEQKAPQPVGIGKRFQAVLLGTFVGAFLGAMIGCSLLMIWFSLCYSPFAPSSWTKSIDSEIRRNEGSNKPEAVITTKHPVTMKLVFYPIIGTAVIGFVFGLYLMLFADSAEFVSKQRHSFRN